MRPFWFGLVITLLLSATSAAFAGDFANLRFIGFSQNGKYLAFEEWGESDGNGGMYSNTYLVDALQNKFLIKPLTFEEDPEKSDSINKAARKKYDLATAQALRKFKILPGNNGRLIVSHLLTDWTFNDNFTDQGQFDKVKFNGYMNPNSPNQYEFYELNLKALSDDKAECSNRTDRGVFKFELALNYTSYDGSRNFSQMLQKDSVLPAQRKCPYSYRIESVYFYDDVIAIFLNVFSHGYEGPDMRYMVVTAQLDYEPVQYDYFKSKK